MSSIIEGYNYDIFISYRQKDNKHDGWVTKFVDNLKGELETTFKEDVSVYFDENPHDRLQETHNVDKSLEDKLKCLLFIPILSQTYCDPKSYAWQYELLAFLKMVQQDRFGKDIKLRSGNVASRILPIRIHDLEAEDVKLFENETGSVLRAMVFVFKTSTGVNRPLKVHEDHPNDNLNKTFYADQINKVAHAIKEIILGMKEEPARQDTEKDQLKVSLQKVREDERKIDISQPSKGSKVKVLLPTVILAILIIAGIIAYPKIFKPDKLKQLRSKDEVTIAVMPFQNMTGDTTWNIWQEGIQNELISSLTNTQELKVRQTETINNFLRGKDPVNYASLTPSVARDISQKLDANIFIYGTIKQAGENIRLNARLVDSKTDEIFRSFEIDGEAREEMIFQLIDSLKRKVSDFLVINKLIGEFLTQEYDYDHGYSNSPEAYRYFIYGLKAFGVRDYPRARSWFLQALEIDSSFFFPARYIVASYGNQGLYEEAKKWCLKGYSMKDWMPVELTVTAEYIYAVYFGTPVEEIPYLKQILEIDEQSSFTHYLLGYAYNKLYQYKNAIPEFERALELYDKWDLKPYWVFNYTLLGEAYHETGAFRKEKKLYKKAEKDFPGDYPLLYRQAVLALSTGKTEAADEYIRKYISALEERSYSGAYIASGLGNIYLGAGMLQKAEEKYREALSLQPDSTTRMNNLGYILIDKEINIEEGLELAEKALEIEPDNYLFLNTKGWGLYKEGNYKEALELIERSWELKPVYNHEIFLHLETAKKAVSGYTNK